MTSFSSSAFSTDAFSELAFDFGIEPEPPQPESPTGGYSYKQFRHIGLTKKQFYALKRKHEEKVLISAPVIEPEVIKKAKKIGISSSEAVEAKIRAWVKEAFLRIEQQRLQKRELRMLRELDDEDAILAILLSSPL